MLHADRGRAQEDIGQRAVAVRAHGHQIAAVLADPLHDLPRRIPVGELRLGGNSIRREFLPYRLEIGAVLVHLGADRVPSEPLIRPAGRDVEQHHPALHHLRQRPDVVQDRAVRGGRVERDQDLAVHGYLLGNRQAHAPVMTRQASRRDSGKPATSIEVMMIALSHAAIKRAIPGLQAPMRFRELVKCRSGNMASGSWRASTTWLSVSRSVTLPSPRSPMMTIAGMMARSRVMSRRTQGWIRQRMNSSMTTCPARVPVIVLLWPLASSATAKRMRASAVPRSGASVTYATRVQSLSALNATISPFGSATWVLP